MSNTSKSKDLSFSFRNFILLSFFLQIILFIFLRPAPRMYAFCMQFFWLIWCCLVLRRNNSSFKKIIGSRKFKAHYLLWLVSYIPLLFILGGALGILALYVSSHYPELLLRQLSAPKSSDPDVAKIILSVLVAPVIEEVTFRGVLLTGLVPKLGVRKAILYSSLAFGVMHIDTLGVLPFLLGLIYSIIYLRSGSLCIPIFMHGVWNSISNLLSWNFSQGKSGPPSMSDIQALSEQLHHAAPVFTACALAGVVISVLGVWRLWPTRHAVFLVTDKVAE